MSRGEIEMHRLGNRTAIITGSSKGIGKAIAQALGSEGANVVIAARSAQELQRTEAELRRDGCSVLSVQTDMADAGSVARLVSTTVSKFGGVDILVNNAGIGVFKPLMEMEVEEFDAMWHVNMRGVFLATKGVLPHMIKARTGDIVNISSLAGKNGFKGGTGYGATKWALRGFASSLMLEVRESNIRVITIFPGSVDTHFSSMTLKGEGITQPEDIAAAVVFAVTSPERVMFSEIDVRPTNPQK
ncbi:MAG: 3-oxoacyl-(acyl-carrier protein) reductase [Bacteroidetes bacterium]|nr:3-oxoacyl-(acyl-carrier protein) reductase [Bacteroidota bacterium]